MFPWHSHFNSTWLERNSTLILFLFTLLISWMISYIDILIVWFKLPNFSVAPAKGLKNIVNPPLVLVQYWRCYLASVYIFQFYTFFWVSAVVLLQVASYRIIWRKFCKNDLRFYLHFEAENIGRRLPGGGFSFASSNHFPLVVFQTFTFENWIMNVSLNRSFG